jgi:hypothetical protein
MNPGSAKRACEAITQATYDWLEAEVATSSSPTDVNIVLNDYNAAIRGLRGGFEHDENFTWKKHQGHMDRLVLDYALFSSTSPDDKNFDRLAGKVMFDGLMEISGTYRNQCYTEAVGSHDYLNRRRKVIGIGIATCVHNRLTDLIPVNGDFTDARISTSGLGLQMEKTIEMGEETIKKLCSRVALGLDLGESGSRSAEKMIEAQYGWLKFTLDSLILVTKLKGGNLQAVPFLEPRSITEQSGKLHYPLDYDPAKGEKPYDWAEVLAA